MNSSVPNGSMVIERWCPEAAHRPTLDEAPVFYPSEEEFKDSLKYIASICQCVEPYGICRIVPPPSWNLPCTLKERTAWQTSKFATHVQKLDKLQNRDSTRKMANHDRNLAKRRRLSRMWVETGTSYGARENDLDCQKTREFGFELGPEFTLEAFQKYADDFKEKYFHLRSNQDYFQKQWEASVENIEEEYWRIVEMPTEEIEVLYGSDIETGAFGSGFPKSFTEAMNSDLVEKYVKSEWNLNNIARHPASMLAFESEDISGVILPWLYVGMCFSSFCWHVEDHHLYSLNYMHWGAPKIWYGVPGKDASKFEAAMRKHLPDLFEEQPDLLHKLVTQLSPSVLKSEAIPVYRCVQHPGEFVVTFPRAYHAGFSCGFNCAEAVNFAPIDWLPQGQRAVELYREQGRHTALSHDKLLLGAAREAVRAHWELQFLRKNTLNNLRWKDVCGKDGILTHALKKRVHMEQVQREYLSNPLKSMKMDVNFDEKIERECIVCHYDLHLSAVSCQCSPDSYACLTHAKQLCSCAWSMRSILFRYEINELNILLEALGGKLSAIHRWANLDLGLTLSSYVSRNKPEPDSIDKPLMEGAKLKEQALPIAINSNSISEKPRPCKEINVTMSRVSSSDVIESDQRRFNSTGTIVGPSPQKQDKNQLPSAYIHTIKGEVIGDNHVQDSSFSGHSIQSGEGALGSNSSSLSFQVCQLSREDTSYSKCIHGEGNSQESPALAPKDKHLSKSNLMESKVNIFLQSEAQSALKECDVRERAKLKEQTLPTAINSNAISEKPRPCKEINVTMSQVSSSEVKESDQRRFNSTGTIVGPSPQKQDKNQLPSAYIHTRKGEVVGDNHVQDSSFSGPSIQSGEGALGSNSSSLSFQVCQLSREDSSYSKCIHGEGNSQESPALAPKDKHLSNSNLMASKVNILLQSEAQSALKECDVKDCGLNTHKSNASVMSERDANYVPVKDKVDHLLHHLQTTRGEIGAGEIGTNHCNVRRRPSYQNLSCNLTNSTPLENHVQDSALREPSHDNMTISARDLQRHQPQGNGRSFDVGKNEMAGSCSNTERAQPVTRPRSRVNYCRRKVPYISNVVRRINYIATPLEYGSVVPGKLWSNSQVIFPKGFKSRVMYISVLDPAKMCYYISEILDAGLTRPVFMVSVEECPSEVFIHMSAAKCWDLVRERVNQEINKHNNLGRVNLPHMQPPGCINGLEMFGFSSSAIIQAIEAIDCKRICSEYWKCRPESRTKHHSVPVSCTRTLLHKLKEEPNHYPSTLLGALFKKANHEELQSMRSILVDNKRSSNYEALVQLLNTEIHSRQN